MGTNPILVAVAGLSAQAASCGIVARHAFERGRPDTHRKTVASDRVLQEMPHIARTSVPLIPLLGMNVRYLSEKLHGCLCGYYSDTEHGCTCSPMLISRYQKRLSGPLLDRTLAPHASAGVDIHVEVPRVPFQKLSDERRGGEPSAAIRGRVEAARARQSSRFANVKDGQGASLTTNADMGPTQVRDFCPVDETGRHTEGAGRGHAAAEAGR